MLTNLAIKDDWLENPFVDLRYLENGHVRDLFLCKWNFGFCRLSEHQKKMCKVASTRLSPHSIQIQHTSTSTTCDNFPSPAFFHGLQNVAVRFPIRTLLSTDVKNDALHPGVVAILLDRRYHGAQDVLVA
jgi:hypothetical protein